MSLVVSGAGACLQITEIQDFSDDEGNAIVPTVNNVGGNSNVVGGEENSAQMRVLFTLIAQLKEQNEQLRNELSVFKCTTNDLLAKTNCALQRISLIPCARQTPRTTITNAPTPYESTL